jgi:hypothetical protein
MCSFFSPIKLNGTLNLLSENSKEQPKLAKCPLIKPINFAYKKLILMYKLALTAPKPSVLAVRQYKEQKEVLKRGQKSP